MSVGLHTWPTVTVATAGTRVQLFTTIKHGSAIRIESDRNNTGILFIGDATVSSSRYTVALKAGDSVSFEGSAVVFETIWADTDTNGTVLQVSTLS